MPGTFNLVLNRLWATTAALKDFSFRLTKRSYFSGTGRGKFEKIHKLQKYTIQIVQCSCATNYYTQILKSYCSYQLTLSNLHKFFEHLTK